MRNNLITSMQFIRVLNNVIDVSLTISPTATYAERLDLHNYVQAAANIPTEETGIVSWVWGKDYKTLQISLQHEAYLGCFIKNLGAHEYISRDDETTYLAQISQLPQHSSGSSTPRSDDDTTIVRTTSPTPGSSIAAISSPMRHNLTDSPTEYNPSSPGVSTDDITVQTVRGSSPNP